MSIKNMSCKNVVWKIGPFVDGELSPPEREEVETHLTGCKDCVELATELRELDTRAKASPVPTVSAEEWGIVWDEIAAARASPGYVLRMPASSRARLWTASAAAAAALFAAGVWVGSLLKEEPGALSTQASTAVRSPGRSTPDGDDHAQRIDGAGETSVEDNVTIIHLPNF